MRGSPSVKANVVAEKRPQLDDAGSIVASVRRLFGVRGANSYRLNFQKSTEIQGDYY